MNDPGMANGEASQPRTIGSRPVPTLGAHPSSAEGGGEGATARSNERYVGLDNCKQIFMFFVVIHHLSNLDMVFNTLVEHSEYDVDAPLWRYANFVVRYRKWIEKIAMPGFSFLSGYFGKGFLRGPGDSDTETERQKDKLRWKKTTSMLLLAPLLWQNIQFLIGRSITKITTGEWNFRPYQGWDQLETWYLFALLLWRMFTTIFLKQLRYPLLTSLFLAFLSAHSQLGDPKELRVRVFFFFPFYIAGLYTHEDMFRRFLQRCQQILYTLFRSRNNIENAESSLTVQREITISRCLGFFGICLTLLISCFVDSSNVTDLSWKMQIKSTLDVRSQVIFFLHYLYAGFGVLSFIIFFKTINFSLFPFGHTYSTLAIYEWHWVVVNFFKVGTLPYSDKVVRNEDNQAFLPYMYSKYPWGAGLIFHVIAYCICLFLGSKWLWNTVGLKHVCDPLWLYDWLFGTTPDDDIISTRTGHDVETIQQDGGVLLEHNPDVWERGKHESDYDSAVEVG